MLNNSKYHIYHISTIHCIRVTNLTLPLQISKHSKFNHTFHKYITFISILDLTFRPYTTLTTHMRDHIWVITISEREWNGRIQIKTDKWYMTEIQEVNTFLKSQYSLSKISTDVYVLILETLLRLYMYTRKTYETEALIPFCHYPKINVMTLMLSHYWTFTDSTSLVLNLRTSRSRITIVPFSYWRFQREKIMAGKTF